jgi:hypothetical protein
MEKQYYRLDVLPMGRLTYTAVTVTLDSFGVPAVSSGSEADLWNT